MRMAFTRHHFAGIFAFALRTLAAHETPMVQEEPFFRRSQRAGGGLV
jgi:hypothetical protein